LKIVVDENIPYGREAFETLGEVVLRPGRAISPEDVRDADMLMVRSITKVNADLLDNSRVRFVATATIGVDHLDEAYLRERGIQYASAPGCNANSVAEYIAAALLVLGETRGFLVRNRKLGIIGHGNVGKKVEQKASALGMEVVLNDLPLARETGDPKYRPVDEIFDCSIITVHVPLTRTGPDTTYHLLDESFFNRCKTGTIIMNTARGSVVDGAALRAALESGKIGAAVLDVWEGEPNVDLGLLPNCAIATPHIAGYSFDGKVNGTKQIYAAACAFLSVTPTWDPTPLLPPPDVPEVSLIQLTEDMNNVTHGFITEADVDRAIESRQDALKDKTLDALLEILGYRAPRRAASLAPLGMPVFKISERDIAQHLVEMVHPTIARLYRVFPIAFENEKLQLAMLDPTDAQTVDIVSRLLDMEIKPHLTTPQEIALALEKYYSSFVDCPELQSQIAKAVLTVYNIREDDKCMRALMKMPEAERGPYFDRLRKEYPHRREFHNTHVDLDPAYPQLAECLRNLGFR